MTTRLTALAAAALVSGLLYPASASRAQSVGGDWMPAAAASRLAAAPRLQLESALAAAPLHSLPPASAGAADQLAALKAWNAAGRQPFQNGFTRVLTSPAVVRLGGVAGAQAAARPFAGGLLATGSTGELAWGTRVTVQDAYRLRLHLSAVHLPAGTRMWVESQGGTPREFGLELLSPKGDLWTPSVKGDSLLFEVHVPAGARAASFAVREVMELVDLARAAGAGVADTGEASCVIDSSCSAASALPDLDSYRHAMAQLFFIDQNQGFLCSGSLLADTKSDFIPYLLTANHCFSDQSAASSLEATFDYFTSSCDGTPPDETTLPTANGAQLLATSATSDFTFVQLTSAPDTVPAGHRFFLGWNANASALAQGTLLYRLSFPVPGNTIDPERYSQSFVQLDDNNFPYCGNVQPPDVPKPRPDFIYAQLQKGGTFGGSSGSPLLLANGQVVGQLFGACAFSGHDVNNGCDYANSELDGAFSVTFPSIATWLSPAVAPGPCVPGATTLCIDRSAGDKRFEVQVSFATSQGGGQSGSGSAIPLSSLGVTEGGLFWFFGPTNPEMLIKVIDGCAVDSKFWVFFAATTNVGFVVKVTDSVSLKQAVYSNQDLHAAAPVQDTSALPCP